MWWDHHTTRLLTTFSILHSVSFFRFQESAPGSIRPSHWIGRSNLSRSGDPRLQSTRSTAVSSVLAPEPCARRFESEASGPHLRLVSPPEPRELMTESPDRALSLAFSRARFLPCYIPSPFARVHISQPPQDSPTDPRRLLLVYILYLFSPRKGYGRAPHVLRLTSPSRIIRFAASAPIREHRTETSSCDPSSTKWPPMRRRPRRRL